MVSDSGMNVDLSIITISTNEADQLKLSMESVLQSSRRLKIEYFVIDNASCDETAELAGKIPDIRLIRNSTKLGFATNNNLALKQSKGRYVLLLNPDTILEDNTLEVMTEYMDEHPDIGASSCKLVNPDGSIQFSARRFPTLIPVVLRWLGLDRRFPNLKIMKRYLLSDWDHAEERDVDWNLGAFLMIRRKVIDQVGMLDTAFDPLYCEDIDLCCRIKQAGWRITYNPAVKIVHFYDRESAHTLLNRMTAIHFRNLIRFLWKHRRR